MSAAHYRRIQPNHEAARVALVNFGFERRVGCTYPPNAPVEHLLLVIGVKNSFL